MYDEQIIRDCYEKIIPIYEKYLKFEKVNNLNEFKDYFTTLDSNDNLYESFKEDLMNTWNSNNFIYSKAYSQFPIYLYNYICCEVLFLDFLHLIEKVPAFATHTAFESEMKCCAKCIVEYFLHKYYDKNIRTTNAYDMTKYASILFYNNLYDLFRESVSNMLLSYPNVNLIISDYSSTKITTSSIYPFSYLNISYKRLYSICEDIFNQANSRLNLYPFCYITFDKDIVMAHSIDDKNTLLYKIKVEFEEIEKREVKENV